MSSIEYSQSAYTLVIGPHVETAIWAIIAAVVCALVLVLAEMVHRYNAAAPAASRHRPKKPDRRP